MLSFVRFLLVPSAAAALVAGCSEYDIQKFESVDVFYQDASKAVDILMVVDDSCSMEPFQQKLGESFDSFMTYTPVDLRGRLNIKFQNEEIKK